MINESKIIEARKMLIEYLRDQAQEHGISQGQIARHTGIARENINRFFKGEISPTLDTFIKIADTINCYLFIVEKDEDNDLAEMMRKRWGESEN